MDVRYVYYTYFGYAEFNGGVNFPITQLYFLFSSLYLRTRQFIAENTFKPTVADFGTIIFGFSGVDFI